MSWPKRTGLVTAKGLAKALKKILNKFSDLYPTLLTPTQLTIIEELIDKLTAFIEDVPQYDPTE